MQRVARIIQWFSDHWPADLAWPHDIPRPDPSPDSPAGEALLAAQAVPDGLALNQRGHIAHVQAFLDALAPNGIAPIDRQSYKNVIKLYCDGKPRADKDPRRGTELARVLDGLVQAGDVRFARRIEVRRQAAALAQKFGLAS